MPHLLRYGFHPNFRSIQINTVTELLDHCINLRLRLSSSQMEQLLPSELCIDTTDDGLFDNTADTSDVSIPITVCGETHSIARLANILAEFGFSKEVSEKSREPFNSQLK